MQQSIKNKGDKYTTTRSLLALIRLCQARVIILFYLGSTPLFQWGQQMGCNWVPWDFGGKPEKPWPGRRRSEAHARLHLQNLRDCARPLQVLTRAQRELPCLEDASDKPWVHRGAAERDLGQLSQLEPSDEPERCHHPYRRLILIIIFILIISIC